MWHEMARLFKLYEDKKVLFYFLTSVKYLLKRSALSDELYKKKDDVRISEGITTRATKNVTTDSIKLSPS
jgi:hypothetical protein